MLSLPQPEQGAAYPQLDLVPRVLNVLFKWKWLIVLCAVVVVVPVAIVVLLKAPQYDVKMKILVKSTRADLAMNLSSGTERIVTSPVTLQALNSEIQIIKSQDLLASAVAESNYPLVPADGDQSPAARERAMQQLRMRMSFSPVPDSNVIEVAVQDTDAQAATRLLNTLAHLYLQKHSTVFSTGAEAAAFFEQQVAFHKAKYQRASQELERFQEKDNIVDIKGELDLNLAKLAAMETQLKDLRAEIEGTTKEIAALERQVRLLPEEVMKERTVVVNPEVVTMRTKLVDLERQRDELLQRYTPKSRFVADKEAEIATIRSAIEGREPVVTGDTVVSANQIKDTLSQQLLQKQATLAAAAAKRDTLMQEKKTYEARLDVLKDRTFDLGRIRGDFDLARDTYFMYEKKAEEARVSRAMDDEKLTNAAVVQPAAVPIIPLPRGLMIAGAASGVAGVVLGVAMAFLLEFFNLTVKDEKDIERFLQVPVLATVRQF
jgi:uncharacterized protein involved in exopolysaccharide biosynthesis